MLNQGGGMEGALFGGQRSGGFGGLPACQLDELAERAQRCLAERLGAGIVLDETADILCQPDLIIRRGAGGGATNLGGDSTDTVCRTRG